MLKYLAQMPGQTLGGYISASQALGNEYLSESGACSMFEISMIFRGQIMHFKYNEIIIVRLRPLFHVKRVLGLGRFFNFRK